MKFSQLVNSLQGKVLKTYGKWTIEHTTKGLCLTDGWLSYWIICYGNGKWAIDDAGVYKIPNKLRAWLYKNCNKYS